MKVPKTLSRAPLLAILLTTGPLTAQELDDPYSGPTVARGFSPEQAFQFGGIDNVNLFNGNLVLTVPIGPSYPVSSSLSYQLQLIYNSNIWDFEQFCVVNECEWDATLLKHLSNAGAGWSLSLGRLGVFEEDYLLSHVDESGARHAFHQTLHDINPDSGESLALKADYSRDGTYLRLLRGTGLDAPTGEKGAEVEFPDGRVKRFEETFAGSGEWLLTEIRDAFGNAITIDYLPNRVNWTQWNISDPHGRTHTVFFRTGTSVIDPLVDRVEVTRFGGGSRAVWDLKYTDEQGGDHADLVKQCPYDLNESSDLVLRDVPLLESVQLPDTSSYHFSYEVPLLPATVCADESGQLTEVTLPTLGKIDYTYQQYRFPHRFPESGPLDPAGLEDLVTGVKTRTMREADGTLLGQWTYETETNEAGSGAPGNGETWADEIVNTVVHPGGHKTIHYFAVNKNLVPWIDGPSIVEYGLPYSRERTLDDLYLSSETKDDQGTLVRSTYVAYEFDQYPDPQPGPLTPPANARLRKSRTIYHDDLLPGGVERFSETVFSDFDGLGHYRAQTTDGNFAAGNVRESTTSFNPDRGTYEIDPVSNDTTGSHDFTMVSVTSPWVLDTFDQRSVSEGGVTAVEQFCFDDTSGFLERRRTLLGATVGPTDVLVRYLDDDSDGNVDVERHFGGDGANLNSDTCGSTQSGADYVINHTWSNGALESSTYVQGANEVLKFVDRVIDLSTGLVASTTAPDGITTEFMYDELGRLTQEKPDENEGAIVDYLFVNATPSAKAQVEIQRSSNPGGTILAEEIIVFDDLGRLFQEKRKIPDPGSGGAFNLRETLYNSRGLRSSVSELVSDGGTPTAVTEFLDYDPFARPGEIVPPDGADHKVVLTYAGVSRTTRTVSIGTGIDETGAVLEAPATTTEEFDRQGRLWRVSEPSGQDEAMVATTCAYDVGNRLASVSTTAMVDGANVTQNRTFVYDNLGFLRSETHPEKAGIVRYENYDARGHAGRKIDGWSTLQFTFDRAERVTQVDGTVIEEPPLDPTQRLLKSFQYGGDGDGMGKGKLIRAERHNIVPYAVPGFGGADFVVVEKYAYQGRGGRVSARTIERQGNDRFTQGFEWTELGNLEKLTYPSCVQGAPCGDSGAPVREVTYDYGGGYGFLMSIPGYAPAISYHANEMLASVAHANGVTDVWTADPNAMRRPARIQTSGVVSGADFDTGDYAYDGAGNIVAMGTSLFLYDRVSRLASSAVDVRGVAHTQSQSYDAFGNRVTVSGTTGLRNLATDPATNRLLGSAEVPIAYDDAGNMTSRGDTTYTYDAFNVLQRVEATSASPGPVDHVYVYTADDERIVVIDFDAPVLANLWSLRDQDGQVLRQLKELAGGQWSWTRDTIRRDGQLLATAAGPSGVVHHYHLDHLGTPRLLTRADGTPQVFHDLLPFGEEPDAPPDPQPFRFTGHERDADGMAAATCVDVVPVDGELAGTQSFGACIRLEAGPGVTIASGADVTFRAGETIAIGGEFAMKTEASLSASNDVELAEGVAVELDYMHARYYSPVLGKFLSVDVARGDPSQPKSWNRYAYVTNNPLTYLDPDGLLKLRATQTPLGPTFTLDFETSRAGILLEYATERAPASLFGRFKRFKSVPDAAKSIDEFLRGAGVETSTDLRDKLADAPFEAQVRDEFFSLLGENLSDNPIVAEFAESSFFLEEEVRLVGQAVTTVVDRLFREGSISAADRERLLKKFDIDALIERAIREAE